MNFRFSFFILLFLSFFTLHISHSMIISGDQLYQNNCTVHLFGVKHIYGEPRFCEDQLNAFVDVLQKEQDHSCRKLILFEKAGKINELLTPRKELLLDLKEEIEERKLSYELQNIENRYVASGAILLLSFKCQDDVPALSFETNEKCLLDLTYKDIDIKFTELTDRIKNWANSHDEWSSGIYQEKLKEAQTKYHEFKTNLTALEIKDDDLIVKTIPFFVTLQKEKQEFIRDTLAEAFCYLFDLNLFAQLYKQKQRNNIIIVTGWKHAMNLNQMLVEKTWNRSYSCPVKNIFYPEPLSSSQIHSILQDQGYFAQAKRVFLSFALALKSYVSK